MTDLTPEFLADLRKKAEDACTALESTPTLMAQWVPMLEALRPNVVLALLDRIATLKRLLSERTHADPP